MRIAFMGGGNMATALIGGLIAKKTPPTAISVYDPDTTKLASLHKTYQVQTAYTPMEALITAKCVIFAVKPQHFEEAAKQAAPNIIRSALILSVAAGIRTSRILEWLDHPFAIVRAMPNLSALIGKGMSALWATPTVSKVQKSQAEAILKSVGKVVWLEQESLLDAVTAVSGSGPAYHFFLMEALEKAAISLGLPPTIAHTLVVETALGAAMLVRTSKQALQTHREQVTSKGGTTEAALNIFQAHGLEQILTDAVFAAKARATELANTFSGA